MQIKPAEVNKVSSKKEETAREIIRKIRKKVGTHVFIGSKGTSSSLLYFLNTK